MKADEYLEEISRRSEKLEEDLTIHLNLLKILNKYQKGQKDVLNSLLNDYLNKFHRYNFKINDFEIIWIFRLIEILDREKNLKALKKLSNRIKDTEFYTSRPISIYEYFLHNLYNYLNIFHGDLERWPAWANRFLDFFEKPESYFFGKSNYLETIRGVEHPGKGLRIEQYIKGLKEFLLEEAPLSDDVFFQFLIEIPNIYIMIIKKEVKDKGQLRVIFNFIKKMHEKIQELNLGLEDQEFNFLNIFMEIADEAQILHDLDLALEIFQFVESNSIQKNTPSSELRFLEFYEVLAERRGEKTLALDILHKMDLILEKCGNVNDKTSNNVKRLMILLSENFTEQVENEIVNLQEDREELTTANKLMIKSLKIFLLIKKKKIIQSNKEALLFIHDC